VSEIPTLLHPSISPGTCGKHELESVHDELNLFGGPPPKKYNVRPTILASPLFFCVSA